MAFQLLIILYICIIQHHPYRHRNNFCFQNGNISFLFIFVFVLPTYLLLLYIYFIHNRAHSPFFIPFQLSVYIKGRWGVILYLHIFIIRALCTYTASEGYYINYFVLCVEICKIVNFNLFVDVYLLIPCRHVRRKLLQRRGEST